MRSSEARSILSPTSGYLIQAGFTHSLTPARNCTFGCTYCYVPTMRVYAGLKPEDWERWGQFTTIKSNAAALLAKELRPGQRIYCSPLTDPYQPAEAEARLMPGILEAAIAKPPAVFVVQTRGTLIERDIALLKQAAARTTLRVSFSVTTNREDIRRLYEPHCAPYTERLDTIRRLRAEGLEVFATLAPILPCDPEQLVEETWAASGREPIGDPLHIRSTKQFGATTKEAAFRIASKQGHEEWFEAGFQGEVLERITRVCPGFKAGPEGFARLSA